MPPPASRRGIGEHVHWQDAADHRRHRHLRQRRAAPLPAERHRRDPHLLARREEAGRHAAPLGRPAHQVLHRRRAQRAEPQGRDGRGGLRLPRRRAQAGALVRVLPDRGGAHQRARRRERAQRGDRGRRQARDRALDRQGGLPDQRHGHLQGDDGEARRRQVPRGGPEHRHLLHPLRQRDGQPRLGHPATSSGRSRPESRSPSPTRT